MFHIRRSSPGHDTKGHPKVTQLSPQMSPDFPIKTKTCEIGDKGDVNLEPSSFLTAKDLSARWPRAHPNPFI